MTTVDEYEFPPKIKHVMVAPISTYLALEMDKFSRCLHGYYLRTHPMWLTAYEPL